MAHQNWIDKTEYPFENRYINIEGYNLHYIDEGQGDIILFVHGVPDWSFGWRNIIKELSKQYRCVAIDNLGFGLSEKPMDADLTIAAHTIRLTKLIEKLNLINVHLVVHDFGGPIGIGYAVNNASNIKSITAFNTWMFPLKGIKHFETGDKLLSSWIGKILYMNLNFSVKFVLPSSYYNKTHLTKNIYRHYTIPANDKANRWATLSLGRALIGEHETLKNIWSKRNNLGTTPLNIVWGMQDKFVPADVLLPIWKEAYPGANFVEAKTSGHFVQEETPEVIIALFKK